VTPRAERALTAVLFVILTLAAIAPVRSYDLFWHLASGRWIVEHRALPLTDPFAVASDREPWVNGSWLAQVFAYGLFEVVGLKGLSVVRGLCAAALFVGVRQLCCRFGSARSASDTALVALAFAGAMPLLDIRPASLAALFVAIVLVLRKPLAHAVLAVLWINIHPSALLAPVIALFVTRRAVPVIASALALLVNPYGIAALTKPLVLMSQVSSGEFVNREWLPSSPATFPLLYVAIAVGALALFRADWWRVALFVFFAYLAIRHARHQPLFFAAFPILAAPGVQRFDKKLAYVVAAACIAFALFTNEHQLGLMHGRFPVASIARLKASGLHGNIYNADQFGGYLIWTFYPERRALTDGRNELYNTFIGEYAVARGDQRAWRALLRKYRVNLAVDEYQPRIEVVDAVTRRAQWMPASLAYWPRKEWALIAYDSAGMVFARRAAFPPGVVKRLEIHRIVD
jgi:hypothetical protein